ncbi:MAG TPA: diguanylate cyclase [Rectinemataceae bacterium]|nr:diguanylate cyclase [Rectinemataceae bacterium]
MRVHDPDGGAERLRNLLDHLPVGVYRVTPEGGFLEANSAMAFLLGFGDVAELMRVNANDLYPEQGFRRKFIDRIDALPHGFEETVLRGKDGRLLWVRNYPHARRDEDGSIQCIDGAIIDVTELKRAEEELSRSEHDYRRLFEGAHDALMIFEIEGEIILDVNDSACRLYGFDRHELIGMSLERISKNISYGKRRIARLLGGEEERTFETSHYRKDGTEIQLEVNATLVTFKGKQAIMSINRDVTERQRRLRDLYRQALTDPLTGIANRFLFDDHLALALAHASHSGLPLAVLFVDLDGFKEVNDGFGHAAGDEVLKTVASRLTQNLRRGDTVARLGGDEFVAVLPELSSVGDANEIACKLLEAVREPMETRHGRVSVSASIGIAVYPENGTAPESLVGAADLAMYKAKMSGKNAFCRADLDEPD